MERYVGIDAHAASCTLAVVGASGKRLRSIVVDTNGRALVEAVKGIGGRLHVCLEEGTQWVALRRCLDCGTVSCCDSSPGRHATAHFRETAHPVMQSAEPAEDWRWCYVHHLTS